MNVACSNCPAKYGVPDDKVQGRKVRITCKRCGAPIVIDGTRGAGPKPGAEEKARRQQTMLGGLEAPPGSAPGAKLKQQAESAAAPGGALPRAEPEGKPTKIEVPRPFGAAVASPAPNVAAKPAPAPQVREEPWTVAVTEDDQREMTIPQIVEAYATGVIDFETFIWRDGMEDWLTPFEIPDIAAALARRGFTPPEDEDDGEQPPLPAEAPEARPSQTEARPGVREQSGAWREPGRWDANKAPSADLSFDDVTVAMAAPKAQELLEAVSAPAAAADPAAPAAPAAPEQDVFKPEPPAFVPSFEDDESTVVADSSRFSTSDDVAAPVEKPVAEERPAVQLAARTTEARANEGRDLFGAAALAAREEEDAPRAKMPSISPEGTSTGLTGARNESSVLFSLDALAKTEKKAAARTESDKDAAAFLLADTKSDVLDSAPNSIANLSAGGPFGSIAAPDVIARPPESSRAAPGSADAILASLTPPVAPEKSGKGLWIALGALLVAGAAAGAAYVTGLHHRFLPAAAPAPSEPAAATTEPVPAPADPPPEPAAPETATPAAEPATAAAQPTEAAPATAGEPAAAVTAAAPEPSAPTGAAAPAPAAPSPTAPSAPAQTVPAGAPKPEAPKPAEPAPAEAAGAPFSKEAAATALAQAAAQASSTCATPDGPKGVGRVTVTFVNSGRATRALVSGDLAGSSVGGCIARVFQSAKVPSFTGESVTVAKSVTIQ